MTKYLLKTYQEEFIEKQEKVGKEATKSWVAYEQSPADRLRKRYSRSDFDPEIRHYAFLDDELIGFQTSEVLSEEVAGKKTARIGLPLVLPGHEEAIELLFEKTISTLKNKGVKRVIARASERWGYSIPLLNKHGFRYIEDLARMFRMEVETMDLEEMRESEEIMEFTISDFDATKDLNQLVKIQTENYDMSLKEAKETLDEIVSQDPARYPIHVVIRDGEKTVAHGAVYEPDDPGVAVIVRTFFADEEKYFKPFVIGLLDRIKKAKKYSLVVTYLTGKNLPHGEIYGSLGFSEHYTVMNYEKEI
ncbi:MAG: hypothetical protein ACFFDI_24860 [Promethearchaeota archaeon]